LLPLAYLWTAHFLVGTRGAITGLHAWIIAALLSAAWPSREDWRMALPAILVMGVLAIVASVAMLR